MKTASDIMTRNPITVSPETTITDAVKILLERRFNGLPVVKDGKLVGIICQSDLVAQQQKFDVPSMFTIFDGYLSLAGWNKAEQEFRKMNALIVEQAMTRDPVTTKPSALLEDIASLMVKAKYYSLPVVENGELVGIIGKEDILRTLVHE